MGCSTVNSAVDSNSLGPGSNPIFGNFYWTYLLLTLCRRDENQEKEAGNGRFKKKLVAAIAQWIRQLLTFCCPGFESHAHHLRFDLHSNYSVQRTIIFYLLGIIQMRFFKISVIILYWNRCLKHAYSSCSGAFYISNIDHNLMANSVEWLRRSVYPLLKKHHSTSNSFSCDVT